MCNFRDDRTMSVQNRHTSVALDRTADVELIFNVIKQLKDFDSYIEPKQQSLRVIPALALATTT